MLFTPFVKNVPSIDIQVFYYYTSFCRILQAMGREECANVRFTLREGCCMMVKEKTRTEMEMSTGV